MDPRSQLTSYLTGKWIPPVLGVVARLRLPDLIAERGPSTAADLAGLTDTHAPSLYRVMRAAASAGVLEEGEGGRFGLTPMAELLRSDGEDSLRQAAILFSMEPFWNPYGRIMHSVTTGLPSFDAYFGTSIYAYFEEHEEEMATFAATAATFHAEALRAITRAYDFSGINTLVDVGGGNGSLLAQLLPAYPRMRGRLLELPGVTKTAEEYLARAGIGDRVEVMAGEFFQGVPDGDAYIIKSCIHTFSDADAAAVLSTIANAMRPGVPLLVAETVIPPGNAPHYSKFDDIEMLVIAGGVDRTQAQYEALLASAGLRLDRSIPAGERFTILEARHA